VISLTGCLRFSGARYCDSPIKAVECGDVCNWVITDLLLVTTADLEQTADWDFLQFLILESCENVHSYTISVSDVLCVAVFAVPISSLFPTHHNLITLQLLMHWCEALLFCSAERGKVRSQKKCWSDASTQIRKVSYHITRLNTHLITNSPQANGRGGFLAVTCPVPLMLIESKHLQYKRERTTHRDRLIND
jgi:hypothetical protein